MQNTLAKTPLPLTAERLKVEILACPCCGSDSVYAGVEASCTYHVKCRKCGTRSRSVDINEALPHLPRYYFDHHDLTEQESGEFQQDCVTVCIKIAINAWNTRPSQSQPATSIQLAEEVYKLVEYINQYASRSLAVESALKQRGLTRLQKMTDLAGEILKEAGLTEDTAEDIAESEA